MIKVAHIYASDGKKNSGDYMIGIATKKYFQEKFLAGKECEFTSFSCRKPSLYTKENIVKLNEFDYIVIGGGGLILPDTEPNLTSAWQLIIPKENYKLIKKPIYVISIGYNLFYGQTMEMSERGNNKKDPKRLKIFRENIQTLIKQSVHFSLRHINDVNNLKKFIPKDLHTKLKYEPCPTIWYVNSHWKPNADTQNKEYVCLEIKDDREWRRYHKITKNRFYSELVKFIDFCKKSNIKVAVFQHDGGPTFYNYLVKNKISVPLIDNSCYDEEKIFENYTRVKAIFCTAGHSQMMSHGMGIPMMSLIGHPKLKNFCEEMNLTDYIEINKDFKVFEKMKGFLLNLNKIN